MIAKRKKRHDNIGKNISSKWGLMGDGEKGSFDKEVIGKMMRYQYMVG